MYPRVALSLFCSQWTPGPLTSICCWHCRYMTLCSVCAVLELLIGPDGVQALTGYAPSLNDSSCLFFVCLVFGF